MTSQLLWLDTGDCDTQCLSLARGNMPAQSRGDNDTDNVYGRIERARARVEVGDAARQGASCRSYLAVGEGGSSVGSPTRPCFRCVGLLTETPDHTPSVQRIESFHDDLAY